MALVMITNDDGFRAPGISALVAAVREIAEVVVVAPERDSSAASHSLTMRRPVRVRDHGGIFSVDGTPTDCVILGINRLLTRRPDLVVSGINPGPNLGDDVNYSGTVSAAVEAATLGIPSFAVSICDYDPDDYGPAASFAQALAARILSRGMPDGVLLNVNCPADPRGVRFSRQGRRAYEGAITELSDPWGRPHYWIGGGTPVDDGGPDADTAAVEAGFISVTPLRIDRTSHETLAMLAAEWGDLRP